MRYDIFGDDDMYFETGKRAGKTTEEVLLKGPDFAQWYISKYPHAKHAKDFKRLIEKFDDKPFTKKCAGECGSNATRASAYWGSPSLMFWCDNCDPYRSGADKGKLTTTSTFDHTLEHIDLSGNGKRQWKRDIIRELAEAKGMPKRVGYKEAMAFFA